jgi:hypothetical protein
MMPALNRPPVLLCSHAEAEEIARENNADAAQDAFPWRFEAVRMTGDRWAVAVYDEDGEFIDHFRF